MAYQEEKIRRFVKIGLVFVGIFLVFGFFSLFMGKSSNQLGYSTISSSNSRGGVMMDSSYEMPAPMATGMGSDAVQVGDSAYGRMAKNEMIASEPATMMISEDQNTLVETDKKVIKDGNLSLQIEDTEKSAQEISNIVKGKGGEVFATNFYERVKGQKSGFVTVKVPVNKFEETINEIKKIATQVLSESTTGQDVTEQYSDLQAQLKNKRAEEESFVKILDTAGKIDDILAVTREISRVRGEIERLEGKIRFMDSQTDMSTITINLTEDTTITPVNEGWRPWQVVKQSVKELIASIQGFIDGIIRFVIVGIPSLIPFAILIGFLVWVGRKVYRKMTV